MTQVQLQQLQKQLWNIANDLRGKMGADEFRDYILGFIFFKYLSEKAVNFADALLADEGENLKYATLDASNATQLYFVEPSSFSVSPFTDHMPLIFGMLKNGIFHPNRSKQ